MDNPENSRPLIFEYTHYRDFLNEELAYLKKVEGMSLRKISERAGFGSHSFLTQILKGKRNPSLSSVEKLADALEMGDRERRYLLAMVQLELAEGEKSRERYLAMLRDLRPSETQLKLLRRDQAEYLRTWYHCVIREMVLLPEFQEDPEWIAERLEPAVSAARVRESLDLLIRLGFITPGEDGKLKLADPNITTGDEATVESAIRFHQNALDLAARSIETVEPARRDISALIVRVPLKKLPYLKEKVSEFRKNLLDDLEKELGPDAGGQEVFHFNFQLFPTTKITDMDTE